MSVARSMSLPAPLVGLTENTSSATRPPIRMAICPSRCSRVCVYPIPLGAAASVTPSARPRGMMVTLCNGSAFGSQRCDDCVSGLVVRTVTRSCSVIVGDPAADSPSRLCRARSIEISGHYAGPPMACRIQRRLVDQVGEVGPGETGSATCDLTKVDLRVEPELSWRGSAESARALHVGCAHRYLSIEAAGAEECLDRECRAGWWRPAKRCLDWARNHPFRRATD